MELTSRPPSIRDVASLAGVSHQTVSRVVNGSVNVKSATSAKVQAAISELGFIPNAAARALATNRSNTLGILTTSLQFFGPSAAVVSIESAARDSGYWVSSASIDANKPDSIREVLAHFVSQSIDGLIIVAPQQSVFDALEQIPLDLPFVTLQGSDLLGERTLSVNQIAGARLATQHLIELGHTKILHIAGPETWIEAHARAQGFRDELTGAGLEVLPFIKGDWTADFGYRAGASVISSACTAVFCANDHMALGLIHALNDAGLRVPQDISVVGFDDTPESAHIIPPLTTIRQDFTELGRRSVDVLVHKIESREFNEPETIAPELVVRLSTSPPRA